VADVCTIVTVADVCRIVTVADVGTVFISDFKGFILSFLVQCVRKAAVHLGYGT
jgi:hypothetical protein